MTGGTPPRPMAHRKHLNANSRRVKGRKIVPISRDHPADEAEIYRDPAPRGRPFDVEGGNGGGGGNAVERHIDEGRHASRRGARVALKENPPTRSARLVDVDVGIDQPGKDHRVARVGDG